MSAPKPRKQRRIMPVTHRDHVVARELGTAAKAVRSWKRWWRLEKQQRHKTSHYLARQHGPRPERKPKDKK